MTRRASRSSTTRASCTSAGPSGGSAVLRTPWKKPTGYPLPTSAWPTPAGPPTGHQPRSTPTRTPTTAGSIALVHNGIIENYAALKKFLTDKGHTFTSQTDTEVLAMLIGDLYTELKAKNHVPAGRLAAAASGAGGAA